eukprot:gene498-560_t
MPEGHLLVSQLRLVPLLVPLDTDLPAVAVKQRCDAGPCPKSYKKSYSAWGSCSKVCGGGKRYRKLQCFEEDTNTEVGPENCKLEASDVLEENCNEQNCANYGYLTSEWTLCDKSCGTDGVMTRKVNCVDTATGAEVRDSLCASAGEKKPIVMQRCPNLEPCRDYKFWEGPWGRCSESCGGGTRSRDVFCTERTSKALDLDLFLCGEDVPAATEPCNLDPCATYNWVASDWSACSATCGESYRSRTIPCKDQDGTEVTPDKCVGTKTVEYERCKSKSCMEFYYAVKKWKTCSAACGGGTQGRARNGSVDGAL